MIIVIPEITISCNISNNTIIEIDITEIIIISKISISHSISSNTIDVSINIISIIITLYVIKKNLLLLI